VAARLTNRWWFWPLVIYGVSRIVSTSMLVAAAWAQGANYWTGPHPDYFSFLNIWDVEWYHRIYTDGYPSALPDGQNTWAFLPLFPYLVKLTFLPWAVGAPLLATAFGLGFALVAYRLFLKVLGDRAKACWSLAFTLFWVASPVLQAGYAESLQLFGIALALWAYLERRDVLLYLALVVVAFSRPGVLAFAATFGVLWLVVLVREKRFVWREFGLAVVSALLGFAWPWIAALATGQSDAYLKTELAWRIGYAEADRFVPFNGLLTGFWSFFGGWFGYLFLGVIVALVVRVASLESVRSLGVLGLFSGAYLLYLAATFYPQSSTWRLILPAFGLFGAIRLEGWRRWLLIGALTAGQVVWIATCWMYSEPDFTPP
jgi:hypothetical protein